MKNSKSTTSECIAAQYMSPAHAFAEQVKMLGDIHGIQAPHIPIAGKNYDLCNYKIAFVGMETNGWDELENFIADMENSPSKAVLKCQDWLNPASILKHNHNATYWRFVIQFLETFYKIDHQRILNKQELHPALSSFVWAETNCIERYQVTAQRNGVDIKKWKQVKELSRPLDSIDLLIKATHPKVVIITDKWVNEDYILKEESLFDIFPEAKKPSFLIKVESDIEKRVKYNYYYLRDQDTHVFVIPHPRWLGLNNLVDCYIQSIMEMIKKYKIWSKLPESENDWKMPKVNKSSQDFKFKFLANLADLFASNNMTITSTELAQIFNTNGLSSRYGDYSIDNGRGILTRVVKLAYKHYMDESHPDYNPIVAQNIAKVFTNKYNHRAWE